ncbi:NAD(P)/FAD-dependent oxidoreductase [Nautilia sp.]
MIILGAGAAGLFLADFLKGKNVLIIEHNNEIGAKIKISGGGKCNITNKKVSFENYYPKSEFVKKALQKAGSKELLKWIKNKGLKVYELKEGQYFFKSSLEILRVLKPECEVMLNTEILDVKEGFEIITDRGVYKSENVVVALGGRSFKKLGATEKGYEIAEKFGHKITPLKPALVGFTVQPSENWFKKLSGVSFKASVLVNGRRFTQNILFSHRGITGPAVLNASLYWEKGRITIDFLVGTKIDKLLKNRHKQIVSQIPLPKAFVKEFLRAAGIEDKKVMFLKKEEIKKLKRLENYEFAPAGTFGFERAEVTKGGICTSEISEYMESEKIKGLYFIGEVLDVTGELGGYNFQWAFSSAYSAFSGLSL